MNEHMQKQIEKYIEETGILLEYRMTGIGRVWLRHEEHEYEDLCVRRLTTTLNHLLNKHLTRA